MKNRQTPDTQDHEAPRLRSVFIANDQGEGNGTLAAWCPWCERLHYHGSAREGGRQRIERRAAHCYPLSASPFLETGYELAVTGCAKDEACLTPKAPGAQRDPFDQTGISRDRLYEKLGSSSRDIRRPLLATILGRRIVNKDFETKRLIGNASLGVINAGESWWITGGNASSPKAEGLPALAAYLFGLPEDIVFIRLIEIATGQTFDMEALDSFRDTYRNWSAAGRPERRLS